MSAIPELIKRSHNVHFLLVSYNQHGRIFLLFVNFRIHATSELTRKQASEKHIYELAYAGLMCIFDYESISLPSAGV